MELYYIEIIKYMALTLPSFMIGVICWFFSKKGQRIFSKLINIAINQSDLYQLAKRNYDIGIANTHSELEARLNCSLRQGWIKRSELATLNKLMVIYLEEGLNGTIESAWHDVQKLPKKD